jgi:hypothetical protein
MVAAAPSVIEGAENSPLTRAFKLVRIMRLIKLARVLRASRIIQRWENSISISYSTRSLASAVIGIMVMIHWMGCFWALLPQLQGGWRGTPGLEPAVAECARGDPSCVMSDWANPFTQGLQCMGCVADDPSTAVICNNPCLTECEMQVLGAILGENERFIRDSETWTCRAVTDGLLTAGYQDQYFILWVTACLVAMLQLVGGVAGIMPSNLAENLVFIFAILMGTLAFAAIQGVIVQVMTTGDPDEINFRQSMDALNFMMNDQHIPVKNRLIVRDYFRRSKKLRKRKSYHHLIDDCLSQGLRADVRFLISNNLFSHVWWLQACEREFLEELSVFIERESFCAKERIPSGPELLNILMQGVATRGGAIIAVGGSWGDVIITSPILRDTREAKALGYCEVAKLSRDALMHTAEAYPMAAKIIRAASLKIAVARAMMVISMYARVHQSRQKRRKEEREQRREATRAAQAAAMHAYNSHHAMLAHGYGYGPPPPGFGAPAGGFHTPYGNYPGAACGGPALRSPAPCGASPQCPTSNGCGMLSAMQSPWPMQNAQSPWPMQNGGPVPTHWGQEPYFPPLPGFEGADDMGMDADEEDSEPAKPADILKKVKQQLHMAVKESVFEVADVVASGPLLVDPADAPRAVLASRSEAAPLVAGGRPAPSPIGQLAITKLDELMAKQDATQAQIKLMEKKLSRLDTLADAVAGINMTLKRAAEGNRSNASYSPARPHMHLPGQRRHRAPGDSDYSA